MNLFRYLFVLILAVFISISSRAQVTFDPPTLTLKFCSEALVSMHSPGLQFGMEYRFKPRHSWQNELGYVFDIRGNDVDLLKINGIRALTEYRYYLGETKMSKFKNFYFSVAARYVYWNSDRLGTFWRDNFAFQQRLAFKLEQHRVSLNMGVGIERQLFHKFSLGFGLLVGRGVRFQNSEGIPEDGEYWDRDLFALEIMEPGDSRGYPDILLRLHLGYSFK
jgi:hypothetical protein